MREHRYLPGDLPLLGLEPGEQPIQLCRAGFGGIERAGEAS